VRARALTLAFLPFHAWEMVHAIALTLVRLVITRRRLPTGKRRPPRRLRTAGWSRGIRSFLWEMSASPSWRSAWSRSSLRRARDAASCGAVRRSPGRGAGPGVAGHQSRRTPPEKPDLTPEERVFLMEIAGEKELRYFETLAGAEPHGLPPDNYQEGNAAVPTGPRPRTSRWSSLDARGVRPEGLLPLKETIEDWT